MVTWEGSDGSSAGAGTRESWGGVQREELRGVDEMVGIGGLGAAEVCVCMYIYLHTYTHHIYIYIHIYTHIIYVLARRRRRCESTQQRCTWCLSSWDGFPRGGSSPRWRCLAIGRAPCRCVLVKLLSHAQGAITRLEMLSYRPCAVQVVKEVHASAIAKHL